MTPRDIITQALQAGDRDYTMFSPRAADKIAESVLAALAAAGLVVIDRADTGGERRMPYTPGEIERLRAACRDWYRHECDGIWSRPTVDTVAEQRIWTCIYAEMTAEDVEGHVNELRREAAARRAAGEATQ